MRVLLVTQMWPSPGAPDLGSFLLGVRDRLEALGHEVEVAAISRRGGLPTKYARLGQIARNAARRQRPDVVFAHFLFPAGAAGALAARSVGAPLVVMAHGQDVANLGRAPGITAATSRVVDRASGVIANSRWLADRLVARVPRAADKLTIADCGVDLDAFAPRPQPEARAKLGIEPEGTGFVCVGSLIERKNVVRLAEAHERLGDGWLTFVGDGPLREAVEGRAGVRVVGRVPHDEIPGWIAAADVLCQPSLLEPFGQAALEAMAMERSVVATTEGGPPEFVTPEAGVLVDPEDTAAMASALERAAAIGTPNPRAREAAAAHSVEVQVDRMAAVLERAVAGG